MVSVFHGSHKDSSPHSLQLKKKKICIKSLVLTAVGEYTNFRHGQMGRYSQNSAHLSVSKILWAEEPAGYSPLGHKDQT